MKRSKSNFRDLFLKKIATILVLVVFLLLAAGLIKAFLYRSDYFKLEVVEVRGTFFDKKTASVISSQLLNLYKGRNIFKINLKYLSQALENAYPDAKDMVLRLALPDKLVVNVKFREPVALVKNAKYYPIDEDGYVLSTIDPAALNTLLVINGIEIRFDGRDHRRIVSNNLKSAMELLNEIKKSRLLKKIGVDTIEAKDLENISFYLKNGIEVRIGFENFRERLGILEKTLRDPRLALDRVKYLDLRFNDVVIGPK